MSAVGEPALAVVPAYIRRAAADIAALDAALNQHLGFRSDKGQLLVAAMPLFLTIELERPYSSRQTIEEVTS